MSSRSLGSKPARSSSPTLADKNASRGRVRFQGSVLRGLVAAFVGFHLVVITLFSFPISMFPLTAARDWLASYVRCVGLNEMWDTFAPNPKSSEQFLKAVVVTSNGSSQIYSFPRMEELSFFERYQKERYRKFAESVLCNDCAGLWPDIEREVARRSQTANHHPDRVILIKFASPINPKTGETGDDAHAKATVLSEQSIRPEDLQ